jgi:hypothetical protein
MWAGYTWTKKNTMIKSVIEEEPIGKRPLGRLRLKWEDCVKRDVGKVDLGANWRELAEDRERLRNISYKGWSKRRETHPKKKIKKKNNVLIWYISI